MENVMYINEMEAFEFCHFTGATSTIIFVAIQAERTNTPQK